MNTLINTGKTTLVRDYKRKTGHRDSFSRVLIHNGRGSGFKLTKWLGVGFANKLRTDNRTLVNKILKYSLIQHRLKQ